MESIKHTTLPADRNSSKKYIITPSQTQEDVAWLKESVSMPSNIKLAGKITPDGSSLSEGGPRVNPVFRGDVRRKSIDVAQAVDMIEATRIARHP